MNAIIAWMNQRKGKVRYSIAARLGSSSYDAASSVFFALRSAGAIPNTLMGNTDTLRRTIVAYGWVRVEDRKEGDIFIWGVVGASEDGHGHTGVCLEEAEIIHCNKKSNGITIDAYNDILKEMGYPPEEIYRKSGIGDSDGIGELRQLDIEDGELRARGWYEGESRSIEIMDGSLAVASVPFDGNGEFDVCVPAHGPNLHVKSGGLVFDKRLAAPRDPRVPAPPGLQSRFYFEVLRNGVVIKRGKSLLGTLSWTNELMYIPTAKMTVPIEYVEFFGAREEVRLFTNKKMFHGIVVGTSANKVSETLEITLNHVIGEWQYKQVPTNIAIKGDTISQLYAMPEFLYAGWNINYLQGSGGYDVDYVYSRQNKLDALTKTCELTRDLFWRVNFQAGRSLDIGSFGEETPYVVSTKKGGRFNIQIIREPTIKHDFDKVINTAVVYGEKSDSGMSSMSLREIFTDPAAQDPNFPVVLWNAYVNNERNYTYANFVKLAPNNYLEFAVIDNESLAAEGGVNIEGTFSFNDLAPFSLSGDDVTDADRIRASRTAYDAAIKRLKLSRRRDIIQVETEEVPADLKVGNRVRVYYDNTVLSQKECADEVNTVLQRSGWFYVTAIAYNIDINGVEYNTLTLEKDLQIDRKTTWQ